MPGFVLTNDSIVNLINSSKFNVRIKGGSMVSIATDEEEILIQLTTELKENNWYGIIINFGNTFSVDVFGTPDGKLENISSVKDIDNEIYEDVVVDKYCIKPSNCYMTNIRLYKAFNNNIDKQIMDLISYNSQNDGNAIINDSADTYLNKEYTGRQR